MTTGGAKALKWGTAAGIVAVFITSLVAGLLGIDFGLHWDEPFKIAIMQEMFKNMLFLPRNYLYPSVVYDMGIVAAVGHLLAKGLVKNPGMSAELGSHAFLILYRICCLFVSLSAVFWCAWMAWLLSGRRLLEAWLAALAIAGSWEFAYHARWITPDALMASLMALAVCLLLSGFERKSMACLAAGAVAAGLAVGTKYNGGLIVLPVAISAWSIRDGRELRRAAGLVALVGAVFVLTTPAAVLEPVRVFFDIYYNVRVYGSQGHGGYTIAKGWMHGTRMLDYLLTSALSHERWISVSLFLAALVGLAGLVHRGHARGRRFPAVIALFPLIYLASFSSQIVMIVRNYLVVFPFIAVFSALGLGRLARLRPRWGVPAVLLITGIFFAWNEAWLYRAAGSIASYRADRKIEVAELPNGPSLWLSAMVARRMAGPVPTRPKDQAEVLVFETSDIDDWKAWRANISGAYHPLSFGPFDINLDYYPSWAGPSRPVWVYREFAEKIGLAANLK